jgi:hypothetical protein
MCRQTYCKAYYEKKNEKILADRKEQRLRDKKTHPDRRTRNQVRIDMEKVIGENYTWTNRRLSDTYQISYQTVLKVRDDLERSGAIPVLDFLEASPGVWKTNRRKWSVKDRDLLKGESFVYFIQEEGGTGPVKIGYTTFITDRIASLQTCHYRKLKIVALLPGSHHDEYVLHQRFQHTRLLGEWFEHTPELAGVIEDVRKKWPSYFEDGTVEKMESVVGMRCERRMAKHRRS